MADDWVKPEAKRDLDGYLKRQERHFQENTEPMSQDQVNALLEALADGTVTATVIRVPTFPVGLYRVRATHRYLAGPGTVRRIRSLIEMAPRLAEDSVDFWTAADWLKEKGKLV